MKKTDSTSGRYWTFGDTVVSPAYHWVVSQPSVPPASPRQTDYNTWSYFGWGNSASDSMSDTLSLHIGDIQRTGKVECWEKKTVSAKTHIPFISIPS